MIFLSLNTYINPPKAGENTLSSVQALFCHPITPLTSPFQISFSHVLPFIPLFMLNTALPPSHICPLGTCFFSASVVFIVYWSESVHAKPSFLFLLARKGTWSQIGQLPNASVKGGRDTLEPFHFVKEGKWLLKWILHMLLL